jgi:N-acyl-D-amino-acid deacylase
MSPEEAALTLLEAYRGTVGIINHAMLESDVQAAIAHPLVAIASDGGQLIPHQDGTTHPRAFGTFPRIFSRYVRELGVISLEEAVRKCTSLPASRLGLRDRGVIREGAIADLTLFDPMTMTDRADFADPWQLSEGVHCVIVNGQVQREAEQDTGVRAGRVVKRVTPTSY